MRKGHRLVFSQSMGMCVCVNCAACPCTVWASACRDMAGCGGGGAPPPPTAVVVQDEVLHWDYWILEHALLSIEQIVYDNARTPSGVVTCMLHHASIIVQKRPRYEPSSRIRTLVVR